MSAEGENNVNNVSAEEDKKAEIADNDDKNSVKNAKEENDVTEKTSEKAEANDEKCKGDDEEEKDEKPKASEEKSNGDNKPEEDSEKDDAQSEEEEEDNKDDTMDGSDHSDKKSQDKDEKDAKVEVPDGKGTALGDIPRIDASISRFKNEDLKTFHQILYNTPGKTTMFKKNIKKFNGFEFGKDSDEFEEKLSSLQGTDLKQLKSICEMIDIEKKGSKEDIAEKILMFLLVPKGSGKPASGGGAGRPKRSAAVKANNRGYSSHDDSDSDERMSPRGRGKGRRPNLKDETSSNESDEDFQPSDLDSADERPRRPTVSRRKRNTGSSGGGSRGRKRLESDDEDDEELSDEMTHSSEDSDEEPKSKKRKAVNNKPKRGTPAKRGRKPKGAAPAKKMPAKRGRKKKVKPPSSEEEEDSDRRSSSEDEPLVKKKSPQPPTDDEIKSYVKHILEGANLEEITMKTVCKQVYAHYPDFDLTHKKDYIKSTVKSLIST